MGTAIIGAILCAQVAYSPAQDKKETKEVKKEEGKEVEKELKKEKKDTLPYEKHDATALNSSLRDVINAGMKLFNEPYNDHAGCYRLYQGSLLTVRPFLAPDLQKKIDTGIANAERMRNYVDRAFELRRVLDEIRATLPAAPSTGGTSTDGKGQVSGKLTFQNKAVAGGYFVTLVGADDKKFSSAIQKDGSFKFAKPLAPGVYRVAIEPIPDDKLKVTPLPARYSDQGTSGITVTVQTGKNHLDLNLVN